MASVNKVILVGNLGYYEDFMYCRYERHQMDYKQPNGREHAPILSITDDMPEAGGGGAAAGVTDGPDVAASDEDDGGEGDGDPDRQAQLKQTPQKPTPSGKHRNATATVGALPPPQNPDIALWRLPTVLAHVPVSRSHWWAGVASGRYPAPVKLSTRCVAWRSADIRALIASF